MKKAFTLIELLIVVAIIAILAAIAVPNFLEAQTRAKVTRAQSDMRSLATGIEAFYIDNNQYPFHTSSGTRHPSAPAIPAPNAFNADFHYNASTTNGRLPANRPTMEQIPTFLNGHIQTAGNRLTAGITTPVSFVSTFFTDALADVKGSTFNYYSTGSGWILWSPGPDVDQMQLTDLGAASTGNGDGGAGVNNVETVYSTSVAQPSQTLITGSTATAFTYDPTNGTSSAGDVYRVKQ